MRTTIELSDRLLMDAKSYALRGGISLKEFFTQAAEEKLRTEKKTVRRTPPRLGGADGPAIGVLSGEQIDEAMFG